MHHNIRLHLFWLCCFAFAIFGISTPSSAAEQAAASDKNQPAPPAAKAEAAALPAITQIDATVEGVDGRGLAGAKVTVTLSVSTSEKPAATDLGPGKSLNETIYTTDSQGRYRIKIPAALARNPALRLFVAVEHAGYLRRTVGPLPVSDFRMQEIDSDETYWGHRKSARYAIINTRLREGRPLAGRVLLPDGEPAAGAKVVTHTVHDRYSWKFHSPDDYSHSDSGVTDRDGRFSLFTDQRATLAVHMDGQAPLILGNVDRYISPNAADPRGTYRLPIAIRPHGRVLRVDGTPVPGAIVVANYAVSCAADEKGFYNLPPLAAGAYTLHVGTRLNDLSQIAQHNKVAPPLNQRQFPTTPLEGVFLDWPTTIDNSDLAPRYVFQAVETVKITAKVEYPSGERPDDGRTCDLAVEGKMNGQRWSGISATADKHGIARLIVPLGVQDLVIDTGLARHRLTEDGPIEIGQGIHLGTVTENVTGLVVIRPRLAKLKVKLKLPAELDRKYARSEAFININAVHAKEGFNSSQGGKQRVWLSGAWQIGCDAYYGDALPGEEIVLTVAKSVKNVETLLHKERLTLAPGEERVRTIEVVDK